jgi:hypothetical protein
MSSPPTTRSDRSERQGRDGRLVADLEQLRAGGRVRDLSRACAGSGQARAVRAERHRFNRAAVVDLEQLPLLREQWEREQRERERRERLLGGGHVNR